MVSGKRKSRTRRRALKRQIDNVPNMRPNSGLECMSMQLHPFRRFARRRNHERDVHSCEGGVQYRRLGEISMNHACAAQAGSSLRGARHQAQAMLLRCCQLCRTPCDSPGSSGNQDRIHLKTAAPPTMNMCATVQATLRATAAMIPRDSVQSAACATGCSTA